MGVSAISSKLVENILIHDNYEFLSVDDILNNQPEILSNMNSRKRSSATIDAIRGVSCILPVYIVGAIGNSSSEDDISLAFLDLNTLRSHDEFPNIIESVFNNSTYEIPSFNMWDHVTVVDKITHKIFDRKYDDSQHGLIEYSSHEINSINNSASHDWKFGNLGSRADIARYFGFKNNHPKVKSLEINLLNNGFAYERLNFIREDTHAALITPNNFILKEDSLGIDCKIYLFESKRKISKLFYTKK